jgi:hypothetical protein
VTRPEILLYEPLPDGKMQLTGADYLVLAADWDAKHQGPPQLMGQLFHYFESPNRFGCRRSTRCMSGPGKRTPTARSRTGTRTCRVTRSSTRPLIETHRQERSALVISEPTTHRRRFLGQMFGAAAAASLSVSGTACRRQDSGRRLDQGGQGHAPVPVRFPAAQERLPAAAHPQLPEHLRDGLQDRPGRSAPSARSTAPAARRAFRWRSTTPSGPSTSSASTRAQGRGGKAYTRNVFNRPTPKDLHLLMKPSTRR